MMMSRKSLAPIRRLGLLLLLAAPLLWSSGCVSVNVTGQIYQHTVEPIDIDHGNTPVADSTGVGDVKHLRIPYSPTGRIEFLWSSNAIGEIAKAHGIEEVYYADLEVYNILGIWRDYFVHIYGKPSS